MRRPNRTGPEGPVRLARGGEPQAVRTRCRTWRLVTRPAPRMSAMPMPLPIPIAQSPQLNPLLDPLTEAEPYCAVSAASATSGGRETDTCCRRPLPYGCADAYRSITSGTMPEEPAAASRTSGGLSCARRAALAASCTSGGRPTAAAANNGAGDDCADDQQPPEPGECGGCAHLRLLSPGPLLRGPFD